MNFSCFYYLNKRVKKIDVIKVFKKQALNDLDHLERFFKKCLTEIYSNKKIKV